MGLNLRTELKIYLMNRFKVLGKLAASDPVGFSQRMEELMAIYGHFEAKAVKEKVCFEDFATQSTMDTTA